MHVSGLSPPLWFVYCFSLMMTESKVQMQVKFKGRGKWRPHKNLQILRYGNCMLWIIPEFLHSRPFQNFYILENFRLFYILDHFITVTIWTIPEFSHYPLTPNFHNLDVSRIFTLWINKECSPFWPKLWHSGPF